MEVNTKIKFLFSTVSLVLLGLLFYKIYIDFFKKDIENIYIKLENDVKEGDLILRQGLDLDSSIISFMSDSKFSHIGIINSTEPLTVLHATTNDKESQNKATIQDMRDFLKESKNIKILRLKADEKTRLNILKEARKHLGRAFVLSSDKDKFYCTTFLEESIKAYFDIELKYTDVDFSLFKGKYLFPQSFNENDSFISILELYL